MKKFYTFLLTSLLLITTSAFSQKNKIKLPSSIYTTIFNGSNTSNSFFINKKLNIKNLKFRVVNLQDLKSNYFSIPVTSISKKPSKYIFESYNKAALYRELEKSFFKIEELYKARDPR